MKDSKGNYLQELKFDLRTFGHMIGYYWHFNIFIKYLPFRYCDYGCEHNRNCVPSCRLAFPSSVRKHMSSWTLGHYHEKFPDCIPEKIVELLIKDNYIIFLTEVIDIRFLTPQYLPFLRPI